MKKFSVLIAFLIIFISSSNLFCSKIPNTPTNTPKQLIRKTPLLIGSRLSNFRPFSQHAQIMPIQDTEGIRLKVLPTTIPPIRKNSSTDSDDSTASQHSRLQSIEDNEAKIMAIITKAIDSKTFTLAQSKEEKQRLIQKHNQANPTDQITYVDPLTRYPVDSIESFVYSRIQRLQQEVPK
jgi:hypothetical protein